MPTHRRPAWFDRLHRPYAWVARGSMGDRVSRRDNRVMSQTRGSLRPGETHPRRPENRLCAAVQLELSINPGQVIPHRLVADPSAGGNRRDRLGAPDHDQDLELGRRELAPRVAWL